MPQQSEYSSLSIIVPMLNETSQFPHLLAHLGYWQARGHEVILVDGGSTDGSAEIATEWGFSVLRSRAGRARQMNIGAQNAQAKTLVFLHADTRLPEQADRIILEGMANSEQRWGRFDVEFDGGPLMLRLVARLMNVRSRLTGVATGDQAIFVDRALFESQQGYAEIPLMEDIELCKRLRKIGAPLCLREKVKTSGRRWREKGVWRTVLLMWSLRWRYWCGVSPDVLAEDYR